MNGACPPWFIRVNTTCVCSNSLKEVVNCDTSSKESSIAVGYCMTHHNSSVGTVVGKCPYNTNHNASSVYLTLPTNISELNTFMCGGFNRQGMLCGSCKEGYGPAVLSYTMQCVNCSDDHYGWAIYLVLQIIPVTVLYILIAVFHVRVASMQAFALFCQVLVNTFNFNTTLYSTLAYTRSTFFYVLLQIGLTFYGIWNLDFFLYVIPPFCVSSTIKGIHVLMFHFTVAFFPLCLILFTYAIIKLHDRRVCIVIWVFKPFIRCFSPCLRNREWNPKASIVSTFATFLLFSYSKILFVSLNLILPIQVYNIRGTPTQDSPVLYYDSTVQYFSKQHLPFAIFAILILISFVFLPPLLLGLYPIKTFRRQFDRCGFRRWYALHIFVETFQGWYKDGTNGTRDFRTVSVLYLVLRIALAVSIVVVADIAVPSGPYTSFVWFLPGIVFIGLAMFFSLVRPYKVDYMNVLDSLILALLGLLSFMLSNRAGHLLAFPLGALPLIGCVVYVLYQMLKWIGLFQLLKNLKTKTHGIFTASRNFTEDSIPDRIVNPDSYRELSEEYTVNSFSASARVSLTPVYTYGSMSN